MTNSDTKIAIAQFGNPDDTELKQMAQNASEKGMHWYYFDETADENFEIEQLCKHYNIVFKCYESKYMEKVK
jgi:hypothetical protein